MAKQGESRLQQRIQKALKKEVGGWWFKVHGGPFQSAGVPDLVGSVEGLFFGLEVKMPKGRVSALQEHTHSLMREEGGAHVAVVITPEEAVEFVKACLSEA